MTKIEDKIQGTDSRNARKIINRKSAPPPVPIVDEKGDIWIPHHNPNKPPRKRKPGQCPHARQKDRCKDCGGSAICIHGKQKRFCRACDGSAFCPHGRQKARCKECGGSSICTHGRQKNRCKECISTRLCVHRCEKRACDECKASSIGSYLCVHRKKKTLCKECKGISFKKTLNDNENSNDKSAEDDYDSKKGKKDTCDSTLGAATVGLLELAMIASMEYEVADVPAEKNITYGLVEKNENDLLGSADESFVQSSLLPIKKRKLNIAYNESIKVENIENNSHDYKNSLLFLDNRRTDKYTAASDNGSTTNEEVDTGEDGSSE